MAGVTQKDIARKLGISQTLVSRILAGKRPARANLHHRILEEGAKRGYFPNHSALALKTGRLRAWSVVVPSFLYIGDFNRMIMEGLWEVACENQHSLSISSLDSPSPQVRDYLRLIQEGRFDGVFFIIDSFDATIPFEGIQKLGVGAVVTNCPFPGGTANYVCSDGEGGVYQAVKHLIEVHGRRRIAFAFRMEKSVLMEDRYQGYGRALREAGIPLDPELVFPHVEGLYYHEDGQAAVRHFLKKGLAFDAVCCPADYVAVGVVDALLDAGLSIPRDVAVTGFDDSDLARIARPKLTTVACDGVEMGRQAGRMMLDVLKHPDRQTMQSYRLPTSLVVRPSCGCAPQSTGNIR